MSFTTVCKVILYIINSIFLCLGLAVLGLGIWAVVDGSKYGITTIVAVSVIVLGAIIFLISFFGCFGAFKVSKCMLFIYAVLVTCILIILLIIGIVAFVNPALLETYVSKGWDEASNTTRNFVEQYFNCCGFYNNTDRPANGTCPTNGTNTTACYPYLKATITTYFNAIAGVGFTIVAVMLFAAIFAVLLACKGEQK